MPTTKPHPKRSKPPERERELVWRGQGLIVAGIDEVGRGAWAGPLVSAAGVLKSDCPLTDIRDSKLLTPKARTRLAASVEVEAHAYGIGVVTIDELNRHGLSWALREAGSRALRALPEPPDRVLLDGRHDYLAGEFICETIIGGDATERCIAAASVVAKVHRDALMRELHKTYPEYGFAAHKGYGTARHREALEKHGPSAVHRFQWKPVTRLLAQALR